MISFFIAIVFGLLQITPAFAQSDPAAKSVANVWALPDLDTSRRIEMTCGGTKAEIICGYNPDFNESDDRICSNNTLIFTLPNGKTVLPRIPEDYEKEDFTPISLSCRYRKDDPKSFYIYTRYLSGSYNCHKCNQEMLFTLQGERINTFKNNIPLSRYGNTVVIEQRDTDYPDDYLYEKKE